MALNQLKKVISFAMAFAVVLSLSCCGAGDEIDTETTTEAVETTASETTEEVTTTESTAETLSEEELDELVQNMPEIVFVMSHHYDEVLTKTNILGFYITNTGEMKMYDFRKIAPDEMYEIPDVYDRLEEATCSELDFGGYTNSDNITENDMISTSQEELTEYYKKLLLITKEAEYTKMPAAINMNIGHYRFYGIKNNPNGEKECVLLYGKGIDYRYQSSYLDTDELIYWLLEKFPETGYRGYLVYNN